MSDLLAPRHVAALEEIVAHSTNAAHQRRARLLLLYHEGKATVEVAEAVGLTPATVRRWRRAYINQGMAIFPPDTPAATPGEEDQPDQVVSLPQNGTVEKVKATPVPASPKKSKKKTPKPKKKKTPANDLKKLKSVLQKVLGKKAMPRKLKGASAFAKVSSQLEKRTKAMKKQLKKSRGKGKKAKKLQKKLKGLDKQLKKARKLIKKIA